MKILMEPHLKEFLKYSYFDILKTYICLIQFSSYTHFFVYVVKNQTNFMAIRLK